MREDDDWRNSHLKRSQHSDTHIAMCNTRVFRPVAISGLESRPFKNVILLSPQQSQNNAKAF